MVQFEASQQPTKEPSYGCPNCNSTNSLTLQRRRIDKTSSIQLWSCNNCGFKWKEIWSSYGQSIWSLQYSRQRSNVKMYRIC